MYIFLIWKYWYLWAAIIACLVLLLICACRIWKKQISNASDDRSSIGDRTYTDSCYFPPRYSRCGSLVQVLPPPYNEVTAKPELYPLVIKYGDEEPGKMHNGLVMHYFRTLSHASTLDSLSSSLTYNVVNEANTIIPPPYSSNNSVYDYGDHAEGRSLVSLDNYRTTSDISSVTAAQTPSSPPRAATSPTIEFRELLERIQQLPTYPNNKAPLNRPQVLCPLNPSGSSERPPSPGASRSNSTRTKKCSGKLYMPLGLSHARGKSKGWLSSRSEPSTPSGTSIFSPSGQQQSKWPSLIESNNHQGVPLLSEQEEPDTQNSAHTSHRFSQVFEQEEESLFTPHYE